MAAGPPAATAAVILPVGFADSVVVRGLDFPGGLAFAPDGRLFVAEKFTTRIQCLVPGTSVAAVVADSLPGASSTSADGGLLGLAVDPGWPARPYLYTFSTERGAPMRIARWTVRGALDDARSASLRLDPGSRRDVLTELRDASPRQNGGTLRFGPDGMLYASVGDDGDPCSAQVRSSMRGAVLRLDIAHVPDGPGAAPPLASLRPPDTPASGESRVDLVWANGLRNPLRFQIDPLTGALSVGDVGETDVEEMDRIAVRGYNGGWPLREGPRATRSPCDVFVRTFSPPAYWYDRVGVAGAIISAGVSRPALVPATGAFPPAYDGVVFLLDYHQGFVRALRFTGGAWSPWIVPGAADSLAGDWAHGYESVADALFGPDGALWYSRAASPQFTPQSGQSRQSGQSGQSRKSGQSGQSGQIGRIAWTGAAGAGAGAGAAGQGAASGLRLRLLPATAAGEQVRLSFVAPRSGPARVDLHDGAGRLLRVLHEGEVSRGSRVVPWDGRDAHGHRVARAVIFARLRFGGETATVRAFVP